MANLTAEQMGEGFAYFRWHCLQWNGFPTQGSRREHWACLREWDKLQSRRNPMYAWNRS